MISLIPKLFTYTFRSKIREPLAERDGGFFCFYCKVVLELDNYVIEHLNDNREDNRLENLVLSCQSCNSSKIYDLDLKAKALKKLSENEKVDSLSARENVDVEESSKEIQINVTNFTTVKEFLEEQLTTQRQIPYKDTLDSLVYLCIEKNGHGSHTSIGRYLDALTSKVAPYDKEIIDKKKVIFRRKQA